jgi:hypothetical protein
VRQDRARGEAGQAWTRSDLVFTTRYGDPIEPRNVNRYFAARCASADVRQITVHDAWRTSATQFRPRRSPADRDADPAARTVRRDDGGIRVGILGSDLGGTQAAGGEPRWLRRAAVLRSCTGRSGGRNRKGARRHGLLTCEFGLSGWRDSNSRPLRPDLPWAWCWSSAVPVHVDEDDHVAPCATIFCGDLGTSARYIEPAWGAGRLRPSPGAVLRVFRVLGDWAVTDRLTTLLAYHGVCNNALIMATSNRKS